MNRSIQIAIQVYGWDAEKYKVSSMLRALRAIDMLGRGDDFIAKNERKYDNLFEMGDGSAVVDLIIQAAEKDPVVKRSIQRSQFANYDSWKNVKGASMDKKLIARELIKLAKELVGAGEIKFSTFKKDLTNEVRKDVSEFDAIEVELKISQEKDLSGNKYIQIHCKDYGGGNVFDDVISSIDGFLKKYKKAVVSDSGSKKLIWVPVDQSLKNFDADWGNVKIK